LDHFSVFPGYKYNGFFHCFGLLDKGDAAITGLAAAAAAVAAAAGGG